MPVEVFPTNGQQSGALLSVYILSVYFWKFNEL